jgi:3,4-dihydroxy 2-butanone 4-phosphate synthase/GTP cyclohydrolase II
MVCTTGISAHDRAKTVQALVDANTKPETLAGLGIFFPCVQKKGGRI